MGGDLLVEVKEGLRPPVICLSPLQYFLIIELIKGSLSQTLDSNQNTQNVPPRIILYLLGHGLSVPDGENCRPVG